jgi:hypothetical protein
VLVQDSTTANAPVRFYRVVTPIQSSATEDSDGDGIPDSWMVEHFGHASASAEDNSQAQDDADQDGMSNLQEYLTGTDPLDPQSCLRLFAPVLSGAGKLQFSFVAVAGVGYTVQYSEALASGVWHRLADLPPDTTTRVATVEDTDSANSFGRFYRVVTPIQP